MPDIRHKKKIGLLNDSDLMRYLFLADFTRMPDQELTDGQVLPVQVGELEVVEKNGASVYIEDSAAIVYGSDTSYTDGMLKGFVEKEPEPGDSVYHDILYTAGLHRANYGLRNHPSATPAYNRQNNTLSFTDSLTPYSILPASSQHVIGCFRSNRSALWFHKDPDVWKYIIASPIKDAGSYPYIGPQLGIYDAKETIVSRLAVANLPANGYPEFGSRDLDVVYTNAAPAQGGTFEHPANSFSIQYKVGALSAVDVFNLEVFSSGSANRLRLQVNKSGDVTIFKTIDNVTTALVGALSRVSAGSLVEWRCLGGYIYCYVGGVLQITAAVPESLKQNTYGDFDLLPADWGISNFTIRTLTGVAEVTAPKVYDYGDLGIHATPSNVLFLPSSQPSSENLLEDGDMEAVDTSAWKNILGTTLSKVSGRLGGNALRVTWDETSAACQAGQVTPPLVVGKRYRLTGWVKSVGASARILVAGGQFVWATATKDEWVLIDVVFTANDGSDLRIGSSSMLDGCYTEWDDLVLTELETGLSGYYNGVDAYTQLDAAALNAAGFDRNSHSAIWKGEALTNGYLFGLSNASEKFYLYSHDTNVFWSYLVGTTTQIGVAKAGLKTTAASVQSGVMSVYANGVFTDDASDLSQFATDASANNSFIGAATAGTGYSSVTQGDLVITLNSVVATDEQMSAIHTHLENGTLTKAYLDAAFGPGNYVWYKHDKPLLEQAENPGLATTILPGPIADGTEYVHEPDFVAQFTLDALPSSGNLDYEFRWQDATHHWVLRINSSGDMALIEDNAGETSRASALAALSGGETLTLIADTTTITAYYDNTQAWTYASASNFQAEETGKVSLGTGGLASNLVIWPRHWPEAHRVVQALNKLAGEA